MIEKHTEAILDSITEGVFTVDENWRIVSFNRAAAEITGVPAEEAVGLRCCEVFRASICERECALKYTLESGRPIVAKSIYIINSQGRKVPLSISTALLRNEDGEIIGAVETFRDMSLVEELRRELEERYTFADILGNSLPMRRLFDILPDIAESDSTVLLEGASGTGKELFARAIHNLSSRSKGRFVAINCGALPDTLLESELFGYKKGAFTDARSDKKGKFAIADGGTLFLDEIGDISTAMQSRLLRVLQERVIEPLGSVNPVNVDVRVIAATNKDLVELVQSGVFREDLYYRINVISMSLPLLKDRKEDIPLLVEHFLGKFNRRRSRPVAGISEDTAAILLEYDYPGNVRELENIIEHALVLCHDWFIEPRHLPPRLKGLSRETGTGESSQKTLTEWEAFHIVEAVRRNSGNRSAAAKELGIDASTLYRKVKSMDLHLPGKDGRSRSGS
jgi:PAS domain S-box-containing protein